MDTSEHEAEPCHFLRLPTELRLQIYAYALHEHPYITIGSAQLVGRHADIVHKLYADERTPHPGLPDNSIPLLEPTYSPSLLSLTTPPTLSASSPSSPTTAAPHISLASLHLLCRQTHHDLLTHFSGPEAHHTRLFLSYPNGLNILRTLPGTSNLLAQTRSLHIAGAYRPHNFSASRAATLGSTTHPPFVDEHFHGGWSPNSAGQLSALIAGLFGPKPTHPGLTKLELRIYYPGSDSYSVVWGDDDSPTVIALRNVFDGEINVEVWRGQRGTGVYVNVTRDEAGQRKEGERPKRVVSTVWRRLEEGGRGEPAVGTWVVDERWPECEYEGVRAVELGEGVVVREG
ncbi:uncharacterized protein LTR77_002679 [Saxophila tyrrhenica]|uniref:F-box domain-containing protein n=1 Tax=Saxophila tyrrhenica TaxID=1690608 RepID=A0AAV9PFC4_9PEZI|nr:hypothetical protein LTR77_002679 [Saxophila tyrrhenica]